MNSIERDEYIRNKKLSRGFTGTFESGLIPDKQIRKTLSNLDDGKPELEKSAEGKKIIYIGGTIWELPI